MSYQQTPSQTIGPFFHYGLNPVQANYPHTQIAGNSLVSSHTQGERIRLTGRIFDGEGVPVEDALIEIWQANANGRYHHPNDARKDRPLDPHFRGFGRCGTGADDGSRFVFATIKPGSDQPGHAPFIHVTVFMRGLLNHVYTRIYFDDEAEANAIDPLLSSLEPSRRDTLLAKRYQSLGGTEYVFDIHMQGRQETVFFDL